MDTATRTEPARRLGIGCTWDELDRRVRPDQWCLFGVPVSFDFSDSHRASQGPQEIRRATPYLWPGGPGELHDWHLRRDRALPKEPLIDLGDVTYRRRFDTAATVEGRIATATRAIRGAGGRPLILGGEHWLTAPAIAGILSHAGEVHVVHLDAHLDLDRRPFSPPTEAHLRNCTVMSHVCDLPGVAGLTQLGPREFDLVRPDTSDDRWTVISSDQVLGSADPTSLLNHIPPDADVYLSIDIDVLDPSIAPDVGWPVPGGLTWPATAALVRSAAERFHLVGCDVVEVFGAASPPNRAARCAGKLLMEVLLT